MGKGNNKLEFEKLSKFGKINFEISLKYESSQFFEQRIYKVCTFLIKNPCNL